MPTPNPILITLPHSHCPYMPSALANRQSACLCHVRPAEPRPNRDRKVSACFKPDLCGKCSDGPLVRQRDPPIALIATNSAERDCERVWNIGTFREEFRVGWGAELIENTCGQWGCIRDLGPEPMGRWRDLQAGREAAFQWGRGIGTAAAGWGCVACHADLGRTTRVFLNGDPFASVQIQMSSVF
jgi:hypothetical protein